MDPIAVWTAAGVFVALGVPLFSLLGVLISRSGEAKANMENLKQSVAAIHRRIDEHAVEDRNTVSAIHDKLDTHHDNLGAQIAELVNALLSKGVIEVQDVPNGRASHG